jgi:hypothetical protein
MGGWMPGRHSTAKRPSRAGPILAAVVAVAVIVALGVYLAPRLTEKSDASGCDEAQVIAVAAPGDLAPAMRAAAAAMPSADTCTKLSVSTVYPESSLSQIDQQSDTLPTIWILESKARLPELDPTIRGQIRVLGSAATTPIVLGASQNASQDAPASWREAFESDDFVLPDPASSPASTFALAALAAEDEDADIAPVLEAVAERQAATGATVADTDYLLRESRRQHGPVTWFPVTEQEYAALKLLRINWDLTALLPASGTTVLDYPILARTGSADALDAAKRLLEFLQSTSGQTAIGEAGFRGADGKVLSSASLNGVLKVLPSPASLNEPLTAWSDAQAAVG